MVTKVLFDTSVMVAAIISAHDSHKRCLNSLQKVFRGEYEGYIATHSIAELYAVLTRMPARPRILPLLASKLVKDNVERRMKVVSLSEKDYMAIVSEMADLHLAGGVVYDAIIARCAIKAKVDILLTLNPDDFQRVWPTNDGIITAP